MNVLTGLDLERVDQVFRGAQKQRFLMTKSDNGEGGEMTIEAILKTMLEGEVEGEEELDTLLEKSDLTGEETLRVKAAIRLMSSVNDKLTGDQLAEAFKAAGVAVKGEPVNPKTTGNGQGATGADGAGGTGGTPDPKATPEPTAKKADGAGDSSAVDLSKLDENTRVVLEKVLKQNDDLRGQNEELTKVLGGLTDGIREKQYTEKAAKELSHIPGKSSDVGSLLNKLHVQDADTAAQVEKILKAANEAIKKGGLFSELGSTGGAGAGGSVTEISAHAAELKKADPKLTDAQAFLQAAEKNPDLYTTYQEERKSH